MTDCTCGKPTTMGDLCTDCFWEKDARLKREHRSNPVWIFQRRYSSAITLLELTPEAAWVLAMQWWIRYHIAIHLGMSHEDAAAFPVSEADGKGCYCHPEYRLWRYSG